MKHHRHNSRRMCVVPGPQGGPRKRECQRVDKVGDGRARCPRGRVVVLCAAVWGAASGRPCPDPSQISSGRSRTEARGWAKRYRTPDKQCPDKAVADKHKEVGRPATPTEDGACLAGQDLKWTKNRTIAMI